MQNEVQIFEHEQFGKVRVVMIDSNPWFVAADVCRALEIKNSRDAITRLENDEKMTVDLTDSHSGKRGGAQFMTVVNEPGFYRLIFSSRKKEALALQRWVYHEVLPAIRKTGSYTLNKSVESAHVPNPNRRAGQLRDACVYVAYLSNNSVKIGQSCNIQKRKSTLKSQHKITIGKIYKTSLMPRKIARAVEKACQSIFSSSKVDGEIFSIDFETACKVVKILEEMLISLPLITNCERGDKLLQIADMVGEIPERNNILVNAANLIAGKNPL